MSDKEAEQQGKKKKDKPRSFVKVPDVFISSKETVGAPKASGESDAATATEEVVRETGKLLAQAKSIQKKAAKWEQKRRDMEQEAIETEEEESLPLVPNTFLPSSLSTLPASKAAATAPSTETKPSHPAPRGASSAKPKAKPKFPSMAPRGGTPVTKAKATSKPSDVKSSTPTSTSAPTTLKSAIKNSAAGAPPTARRISIGSDGSSSSDDADYYHGNLKVKLLQQLETITWKKHDDVFATFYEADGKATQTLTFGQIWDQSGVVSYHLRVTWKLQKGQTVALVLDYGLTYIATWLGCLRAGVVPIVVASPIPPNFEIALTKLNVILHAVAPVALILTDSVVKFWKKEDENDRKSPTRKMWPEQAPWKAVDKLPKSKAAAEEEAGGAPPRDSFLGRSLESLKGSLHTLTSPSSHKRGSEGSRQSILQTMFGRKDDDGDEEGSFGGPSSPRISFFGGSQHSATGSVAPIPRQSIRASIFGQGEKEPLLAGTAFDERSLQPSDVCCYQATSGSTADPKIVMVTFHALYESLKRTRKTLSAIFSSQTSLSGLTWVPPDHHLGLFLAMLCPLVSGCKMHYMSSVNYEDFPLQWLRLLSTYKVGWTLAPDNGYRWVIREFMKTLNASTTIMTSLNLSSVKVLLNIGESPRFGTPGKIRKCFVPYWLPKDCSIMTGYGLAEHVLPISWIEQDVISVPTCNNFALTKRVAVADREQLENDEIAVIVVDPSSNKPVSKGQVGELWIWSPYLAHLPGYFKNKKLTKKNYQAKFKGSKMAYLRTGDVGLFKDNHLYVCCRKEDVLANSQGIKFCPPDIEWFAEDCRPEIKPGRVAAFASVAGTVEIALEVYESTTAQQTRQICRILADKIPKFTRMEVSSVVALPQGKLPITPISTVKRRHAKGNLLKEELPILFDFPERQQRISLDKNPDIAPIMDSFSDDDDDEDTSLVGGGIDSPPKDQSPAGTSEQSQKCSKEENTASAVEKKDDQARADPEKSTTINVKVSESGEKEKEVDAGESASLATTARDTQKEQENTAQPKKTPFKLLADKFGGSAPTKKAGLGLPVTAEKVGLKKPASVISSARNIPGDAATPGAKVSQKEAYPAPASKTKDIGVAAKEDDAAAGTKSDERIAEGSTEKEPAKTEMGATDASPSRASDVASGPGDGSSKAQEHGKEPAAIEGGKSATAGTAGETMTATVESANALGSVATDMPSEQENTADSSPGAGDVVEQNEPPGINSTPETPISPRGNLTDDDASPDAVDAATSEDANVGTEQADPESLGPQSTGIEQADDRGVLDTSPTEPNSDESLGDYTRITSRPNLGPTIVRPQSDDSDPQEDALEMNFGPAVEDTVLSLDEKELSKILSRYLGPSFDSELSWEESGLSSTASVAMRRELESAFLTTLPPDFLDRYPTPADLKMRVRDIVGGPLEEFKPPLYTQDSYQLSWCTTGLLQALLMVVMFLLFSAPLVPCWLIFESLQAHKILYMLLVPIYLGSYSVVVIVVKWLVIGRYREGRIRTPSLGYLRFWFVDRLIAVWECWVGRFIVDTPLLWLFYTFMGARLSPSCQIAGFVREMDLVSIGPNSSLKYPCLKCRKFIEWDEHSTGPIMAFRAISIGKYCTVRGLLSPGVQMDEGSIVEKLCVVPDGAIIQGESLIAGNPAYVADETDDGRTYPCWILVGFFKIIWLVLELAFIYGIWEGAVYLNPPPKTAAEVAPFDFAYWALFAATCLMISLLSSIVLKLLLIGSRRPGKQNKNWCYYPFEWAADYHFNLITLPFRLFARNSRLSNVVLMLHGMDVDFASKIEMESFPPSKMDLLRVRRSMLGTVTLDVKKDCVYYRTNIEDSSVGQFSHIDEDTLLVKALIPPITRVDESVVHHKLDPERAIESSVLLCLEEAFAFVLDVLMFVKVSMTGFVAYMVWHLLMDYVSITTCVPICAASLAAQGLVWNCIFILVERLRFCRVSGDNIRPWIPGLHWVYRTTTGTFQEWSFLKITYGSPIFGILAHLMGVSFEGRALYFGDRIFDFPLATIEDRTVIDGAVVAGHNICYDRIIYGRTCTAGLVYEKSIIMANKSITTTKKETGPWECVVETPSVQAVTRRSSTVTAMLPRGTLEIEDIEKAMLYSE